MIQELNLAGRVLNLALETYLSVCLTFQNCYFGDSLPIAVPPELSSHIIAHGQLMAALELKLRKARDIISQAHNFSHSLVPIHKIPPEIIERIFLFMPEIIRRRSNCGGRPEVFSQVCSRWRSISLGLPALWRNLNIPFVVEDIDLVSIQRTLAFAARARPVLLDVLFYTKNNGTRFSPRSELDNTYAFYDSTAPYTRSLEIVFDIDDVSRYHPILSSYIRMCAPGTLTTLITSLFLVDEEEMNNVPEYIQNTSSTAMTIDCEQVLESLTVLRLQGVYPIWTSKAYHGLVELRLSPSASHDGRHTPLISERHLWGILKASPALRILQLSIGILQSLPKNARIVPVLLEHLEVLNVARIRADTLGTFLRWLSPASKPLQFVVVQDGSIAKPSYSFIMDDEIKSFFSRSNVTRIYAESVDHSNIFDLLDLCPRLKTLAWYYFNDSNPTQARFPISHPCLESLFIGGSLVDQEHLFNLIGNSSSLHRVLFSRLSSWSTLEQGWIEELKVRSGIPDVRQVDYDPARDYWEGLHSWRRD